MMLPIYHVHAQTQVQGYGSRFILFHWDVIAFLSQFKFLEFKMY